MKNNKESDNDWFRLESNKEGTKWFGKCWYIHNFLKYEFEIEFDVSNSFSLHLLNAKRKLRFLFCPTYYNFMTHVDTRYIPYNST